VDFNFLTALNLKTWIEASIVKSALLIQNGQALMSRNAV